MGKRGKYFAKKIETNYGKFDSLSEYERYLELLKEEREGKITDLQRQVEFEVLPKLVRKERVQLKTKVKYKEVVLERAVKYTPDFTYKTFGKTFIEEVKSRGTMQARDYPLRRKLLKHLIKKHNERKGCEDWVFKETIVD